MATLSTDRILDEWLNGLETGAPFYADGRRLAANGLVLSGPWRRGADLAEYLPAGRRRPRPLLLVTGDEWPSAPFQTNLQWLVRMAISRRINELGADMVLIPFSALDSAGVIRSTIRTLEIRPDRETVTYESVPFRLENLETAPVRRRYETWHEKGISHVWPLGDGRRIERLLITSKRDGYGAAAKWLDVDDIARAPMCYRSSRSTWGDNVERDLDSDTWRIVHRRHWLGDCVFTAEVQGTRRRRREWTVLDVIGAARDAIGAESADVWRAGAEYFGGRYSYQTSGRSIALQRRLLVDQVAPASARLADVDIGAPIEWTEPVRRRRRFISSFDANEPAPLYYLATLPTSSRAETVLDAELDLAPAAVHSAILRGRDVRRQGDIFLIETDLDDTAVYATCDRRARLTQWTRYATPRSGEVGAYRPISRARWRLMRRYKRDEWRTKTAEYLAAGAAATGPKSAPGARRKAHRGRLAELAALDRYRRTARAAVLRGDGYSARRYRELAAGAVRTLDRPSERVRARDSYRGAGTAAIDRRTFASATAWRLYSGRPENTRDRLRETLAVYQTAHSATEVAVIDGRPYVKGIVRHVPSLIGDTWRRAEHIPVKLPAGRWYLAVRNTVPRLDGRG